MSLTYNPQPTSVPAVSLRDDIVLITPTEGLPAASGGYHPLDANYAYEVDGNRALTAPITPNGAAISGRVALRDTITSELSAMFAPSGSLYVRNMILDGGFFFGLFSLLGTGAETLMFENVTFFPSASLGSITDFKRVVFSNCRFGACGKIQLIGNDQVTFSNCEWEVNVNPVEFSGGANSVTFSDCHWLSSNSGTYIKFLADGSNYETVTVVGNMRLGASKTGIDGGETGGTPATFASAKYGVAFDTNGGTDTQNIASWTSF